MQGSLTFVILLLFFILGVSGGKPNIVIFLADDLGYGDLGCYGNTSVSTPNIDGLARKGVKMTQHLASASVCTPSRAALLTGRYQIRSGMAPLGMMRVNTFITSTCGLPPSEVTIAELTRQAAYTNAYIGKWHLGQHAETNGDNLHHPLNQGFDFFYGFIGTNLEDFGQNGTKVITNFRPYWYLELFVVWVVTVLSLWNINKTGILKTSTSVIIVIFWSLPVLLVFFIFENYTLLCSALYRNYDLVEQPMRLAGLSQILVNEGLEFINNTTAAGKPFLLFLAWNHMHTFLETAPEFEGRTKIGKYGDALMELDWSVGEIVNGLDKHGIANNTLVYFTSDNGGHLEIVPDGGYNGILKGGKSHGAPDGGIRVPGIIKWPNRLPTGTVVNEMTSLMDVIQIVSFAAGVTLPNDRHIDGRDIMPLLRGDETVSPHEFLFHYCGTNIHAVRYRPRTGTTTWKFVTHAPPLLVGTDRCNFVCSCNDAVELSPPLLYDMTSDPGEVSPLNVKSDIYTSVSEIVYKAIDKHKASIVPVPSQFIWQKLALHLAWQPCCNGTFPFNCKCVDAKYT